MSLKSFFDRLDVKHKGYKVNYWLTRGSFVVLLLLLFVVVQVDGLDSLLGDTWVECEPVYAYGEVVAVNTCVNPFFIDSSSSVYVVDNLVDCDVFACEREFIYAGEVLGYKPSWLARYFNYFTLLLVFGGLFLNHFLYNRNWRFKKDEKY